MNLYLISLGCDKNLVDSQTMIDLFQKHGHCLVNDVCEADAAIVNTCCFIESAKEESIAAVLEMIREKQAGHLSAVVMAGCMAKRYRGEIAAELPEVDALIDTDSIAQACEILETLDIPGRQQESEGAESFALTTPSHYAYIKIAEGCDKHCTYCVIPSIRGPYRSFLQEDILKQACRKVDEGAQELILIAQETTRYGVDTEGKKTLVPLLEQICSRTAIPWIRLLYCYPEEVTDELIGCMAAQPQICHYIDLPIQHAGDRILRAMGRRTDRRQIEEVIAKLRTAMPDIAIRTTLITGFPGETEEDHQLLMDFVREMRFDRLGVFTYSQEEGTPAASMPDQIDEQIKLRRQQELYQAQQEIVFAANRALEGQTLEVLIEGRLSDEPDTYVGRSYRDAPDVDGMVFVKSGRPLESGDFCRALITGASGYDLIAKEDATCISK